MFVIKMAAVLLTSLIMPAAIPRAQSTPIINYEGEKVTAIDLASRPEADVDYLRALIVQQVGQPYSKANNSDPGARLAIQERLASNLLFTFATDLTDTQNEVVQVKYQTRSRLSISLTRDEYGSYAIEIKTRKTF